MPYTTPNPRHYTVGEQRDRLPLYLREFYETRQLDRVTIDGNELQGYFEYSYMDEKSYVKSPIRSSSGAIENLNSYASFLTPRLVIRYNYMHIEDYRTLMKLIRSKNEFVVECYDIVLDKRVTHKMYFAPANMPSIHQRYLEVLGVKDYTVELIGTNASLDTIEVRYYDYNNSLIAEATQYLTKGTEVLIGYNFVAPTGYRFDGIWKSGDANFRNGEVIRLSEDLELVAQLTPTDEYTLTFDYGNGNVLYSQTTGAVNAIKIVEGQSIGEAINSANITLNDGTKFAFPAYGTGAKTVKIDDKTYTPYEFKGWYWTTEIASGSQVTQSTIFDYTTNRTLHQIYSPISYTVTFVTNNVSISFDTIDISYGASVSLPIPNISGYTFEGWYLDASLTKAFSSGSIMPPYNITLYGKWVVNQ